MLKPHPSSLERRVFLAGLLASAGLMVAVKAGRAQGLGTGLRGSLDASTRGLAASGGGDQTRQLQSLLHETGRSGEVLFLPPGDYLVGALDLPLDARIAGIRGATRLFGPELALRSAGTRSASLTGLSLDGLARRGISDGPPVIDIVDCPDLVLDDCRLAGAAGNAVSLMRSGGRIENCAISGAGLAAVISRDATGLSVTRNTIEDCGNGGILVYRETPGPDGTIVTGNRIARTRADAGGTGQNGNAINMFKAHGVTVTGNRIDDSAFSAIRSNGGSNAIISANQCRASGETAIYSEFVFEGAVIEGNIVDGACIGISVANFNEGGRLSVCSGNLIRNLRTRGPYPADSPGFGMGISVEADTVVSNNVIEGAPLFGIKLGWGPYLRDVAATGNVIRDCRVGIAVSAVEGSGSALIAQNVISGSTAGAIIGYRWAEAVTGDLARDEGSAPSHVSLAANFAR